MDDRTVVRLMRRPATRQQTLQTTATQKTSDHLRLHMDFYNNKDSIDLPPSAHYMPTLFHMLAPLIWRGL